MAKFESESILFISVHEDTIWNMRVHELETRVLHKWTQFTIWNAGKQGRKLFRSLSTESRSKVVAMCDVSENRIEKRVYTCELIRNADGSIPRVPIVHFREAQPPFVICIKLDLTDGEFEKNLDELRIVEGTDYYHFS